VLPSIEDLNISFNRLEKFSCSSRSLLVLKLSFNYLKTIEKIKISSLEELILNDNEIADIEWLKENKWANLINIYLHSNRIS
jgi:Leucine-rich repeat (LRR) protein